MTTKGKKKGPVLTLKPTEKESSSNLDKLKNFDMGPEKFFDDLELGEELGRGQYGVVLKVTSKSSKKVMALKQVLFTSNDEAVKQMKRELEVLSKSKSPSIVEFYASTFKDLSVFYCMEFMDAGSLESLSKGGAPEPVLAKVAISVIEALKYIKDNLDIMHRDVKPSNILANSEGKIKVCDFGISGQLVQSLAKTHVGSCNYMAPERINPEQANEPYDVRSDVWSLGMTLIEIGNGTYPFQTTKLFDLMNNIVIGEPPKLKAGFSQEAQNFVAKCLRKKREDRPYFDELLHDPWIQKYQTEDVDMAGWVKEAMEKTKKK